MPEMPFLTADRDRVPRCPWLTVPSLSSRCWPQVTAGQQLPGCVQPGHVSDPLLAELLGLPKL